MKKWVRLAVWSVLVALLGYMVFPASGRTADEIATVLAVLILATILVTRTLGHVLLHLLDPPDDAPRPVLTRRPRDLGVAVSFYGAVAMMLIAAVSLYLAILPVFLSAVAFVALGMPWAALGALSLSGYLLLLGTASFVVFVGLAALMSALARDSKTRLRFPVRGLLERLAATAHA